MDGKTLARTVAVIFVAAAVTAAALGMSRNENEQAGGRGRAHNRRLDAEPASRWSAPLPGPRRGCPA
ncbi:hypothetical protein [Mesorhizobium caraganae]|uniref:hypothetical protein n=1 Tax=Mesorhizobium caraganae TaxID=483206 RepID=UPI002483500A|nr:hypothetical protein [Mesorhizobium caraganae]